MYLILFNYKYSEMPIGLETNGLIVFYLFSWLAKWGLALQRGTG